MKILYIVNGIGFASNVSLGGSDKRAMEIGARLQKAGHQVFVLTTPIGAELLKGNLSANYFVIKEPFFLGGEIKNSMLGRLIAYGYLGLSGCFYPLKERFEVVFPTSDFFFDLLPAIAFKMRGAAKRIVSIVHHAISEPFKRKGGIFKNLSLFVLQRTSFVLIALFSDKIFVYATKEGDNIKNILQRGFGVSEKKMASVICGIDLKKMEKVERKSLEYTACFVGGLRPAKGLDDFVPIWKEVASQEQNAKLLIVGGGVSNYLEQLNVSIKNSGLEKNITLITGHLPEARLYEILSTAKLLILPSYEEGWSIIICEALSLGLPAVVYNLDVFEIFSDAVFKVGIGDTKAFAQAILKLEKDDLFYQQARQNAQIIAKLFDWDKAAEIEEQLLSGVITKDHSCSS